MVLKYDRDTPSAGYAVIIEHAITEVLHGLIPSLPSSWTSSLDLGLHSGKDERLNINMDGRFAFWVVYDLWNLLKTRDYLLFGYSD